MAAFVLVHGAWHGAWCWYKVRTALERRGHWVATPNLSGHGTDRTPVQDLSIERYIAPVVAAINSASSPPIVVGHSMGGMMISLAAEAAAAPLHSLIYLCAFLPRNGESVVDLFTLDQHSELPGYLDAATGTVRDEGLVPCFYADCSADDVTLARLSLNPQPQVATVGRATLSDERFGKIARRYIVCTQDRAISPTHQRWMAARYPDTPVAELNTSHSPFFSAPEALVNVLLDALLEN